MAIVRMPVGSFMDGARAALKRGDGYIMGATGQKFYDKIYFFHESCTECKELLSDDNDFLVTTSTHMIHKRRNKYA